MGRQNRVERPRVLCLGMLASACATQPPPPPAVTPSTEAAEQATAAAKAFVLQADGDLRRLWRNQQHAMWVYETDITDAHEALVVEADEALMAWMTDNMPQANVHLQATGLTDAERRQLELVRRGTTLRAPSDAESELGSPRSPPK